MMMLYKLQGEKFSITLDEYDDKYDSLTIRAEFKVPDIILLTPVVKRDMVIEVLQGTMDHRYFRAIIDCEKFTGEFSMTRLKHCMIFTGFIKRGLQGIADPHIFTHFPVGVVVQGIPEWAVFNKNTAMDRLGSAESIRDDENDLAAIKFIKAD